MKQKLYHGKVLNASKFSFLGKYMRAVVFERFGSPDVMHLLEVPIPEPEANQALIKIEACGVNFAETLMRRNLYPISKPLPFTPGFEFAGVIHKLGSGAIHNKYGLAVGDRVVALGTGGYSDFACAEIGNIYKIFDGLSFEEAVSLPGQGLTALFMLEESHLRKTDTILIHAAAGGVGSFAVQIAAIMGAGQVVATASSDEKLESIAQLVDKVKPCLQLDLVNYGQSDWMRNVSRLTSGLGIDILFDGVGGEIFKNSIDCMAFGGRIVVFGQASTQPTTIDPSVLMLKDQSIVGFSLHKYVFNRTRMQRGLDFLMTAVLEGRLFSNVQATFPLAQASEVHQLLEDRKTIGKLLLLP